MGSPPRWTVTREEEEDGAAAVPAGYRPQEPSGPAAEGSQAGGGRGRRRQGRRGGGCRPVVAGPRRQAAGEWPPSEAAERCPRGCECDASDWQARRPAECGRQRGSSGGRVAPAIGRPRCREGRGPRRRSTARDSRARQRHGQGQRGSQSASLRGQRRRTSRGREQARHQGRVGCWPILGRVRLRQGGGMSIER